MVDVEAAPVDICNDSMDQQPHLSQRMVGLGYITVQRILKKLTKETLIQIAKVHHISIYKDPTDGAQGIAKSSRLVKRITIVAEDAGLFKIISDMKHETLQELCKGLNLDSKMKQVLKKRALEKFGEYGAYQFLDRFANDANMFRTLIGLMEAIPQSDDSKELLKQVCGLLHFIGFRQMLDRLEMPLLKTMLDELSLRYNGQKLSKIRAINAITYLSDVPSLPSEPLIEIPITTEGAISKKAKTPKSTKKVKKHQIEKGVSLSKLQNEFTKQELVDWCTDQQLEIPPTSKKNDLAKLIHNKLAEDDKENTPPSSPLLCGSESDTGKKKAWSALRRKKQSSSSETDEKESDKEPLSRVSIKTRVFEPKQPSPLKQQSPLKPQEEDDIASEPSIHDSFETNNSFIDPYLDIEKQASIPVSFEAEPHPQQEEALNTTLPMSESFVSDVSLQDDPDINISFVLQDEQSQSAHE